MVERIPELTLSNGVKMPRLGFGVCLMPDGEVTSAAVLDALAVGYRNIDTAAAYGNEAGVGQGIRRAQRELGIAREEVFLSTKAWHTERGYEKTLAAFDASLDRLGLDYVDLYLIHWPANAVWHDDWRELNLETWRALEEIYASGRARAIGLSNFLAHHVQAVLDGCDVAPMVNQIEYHPGFGQVEAAKFCLERGIAVEAWSPLGRSEVLQDETIGAVAAACGKTPAQVCLRWGLQKDLVPLPKSTRRCRMEENADVFDFELSAEEMERIDALPFIGGMRFDPDTARS